ncbi:MAG: 2-C-methyl-D-erythritol 4-phosphate cytidylyltransferase, partial [Flavobacteriales bacterium]|nr:2-C-methyl-D-erythritol 4-phosphate cytidylyltransferase [Flavobacteriales bacterium]
MSFHTHSYVIIAAGGSGSRFNSDLPKQFVELQGVPILMRTIDVFKRAIPKIEVILVLPGEHVYLWDHLRKKHEFELRHTVVTGGDTRFNSVKNGLSLIESAEGLVAIHDGVRPLVSKELIKSVFNAAEEEGNAVPVINVNDSLRKVDGTQNTPVNRNDFRIVQTPQCFELE